MIYVLRRDFSQALDVQKDPNRAISFRVNKVTLAPPGDGVVYQVYLGRISSYEEGKGIYI